VVSAAIYKWLCGILFALAVPQPTGFGTELLSFFVLLFSSGCIGHFGWPSGTETADSRALAVFQKG
jgi:hypothetical protein